MKRLLQNLIRWFLLGLVVIIVLVIIAYQVLQAHKLVSTHIDGVEVVALSALALVIGFALSYFYLAPIKICAKFILKFYSAFYEEFFKQGSKYFATGNKHKPFESIVQVAISDHISMLGFVTNITSEGNSIVFVPTSRRLTSGINIIVNPNRIRNTEITAEQLLKFVVTSGAFPIDEIK